MDGNTQSQAAEVKIELNYFFLKSIEIWIVGKMQDFNHKSINIF